MADTLLSGGALTMPAAVPPSLYNPAPIWAQIAAQQPGATPTSVSAPVVGRNPIPAPPRDPLLDLIVRDESGNRNVPNYRFDPGHTAQGYAQITDTNWRHYAPLVGIDLNQYPHAMAAPRDVQLRVAERMKQEQGLAPWLPYNPQLQHDLGVSPEQQGMQTAAGQIQQISSEASAKANAAYSEALQQIKSLNADAPDFQKRVQESLDRADRATDALMRQTEKKPEIPTNQALEHFGSLASILGMLGGMLTKRPAIGALNAAAAAVGAANQGDWQRYKASVDAWKTQSDMLLHISEMQQRRLQNILEDRRLTMSDRLAQLNAFMNANQMTVQAATLAERGPDALLRLSEAQQRASQMLQMHKDSIQARADAVLDRGWHVVQDSDGTQYRYNTMTRQATTLDGKPYSPKGAAGKVGAGTASSGREADIEREVRRLDDDWTQKHPDATEDERQAAHFDHRKQAETQISEAKMSPRSGRSAYIKKYMEEHPEATSSDIRNADAAYTASQSVERAFGSGLIGRNLDSLNTVADHILRVEQYASALQNGNVPRANQIANLIAKESGKPAVTTFEAGRDIMADEVVRLLTATGGTEADRKGMQERLSSMFSPAQFSGVFDVFRDMTAARFLALEQHYTRGDPQRKQYFEENMLTPDARKVFATFHEPAAPAAGGTAQYKSAGDVTSAYKEGRITRDQAAKILRDNGWAQ